MEFGVKAGFYAYPDVEIFENFLLKFLEFDQSFRDNVRDCP
jgi:hypothetical protein